MVGIIHIKKAETFVMCLAYELYSSSPARRISSGLSIPLSPLHFSTLPPNSFVRFVNSPVTSKTLKKLPFAAFALKRFFKNVDFPEPIFPQHKVL